MSDSLKEFLKQPEVQDLINSRSWDKLFEFPGLTSAVRKELYNVLKGSIVDIFELPNNNNNSNYYLMCQKGNSNKIYIMCATKEMKKNTFDYAFIDTSTRSYNDPEPNYIFFKFDNYDEALAIAVNKFYGQCYPKAIDTNIINDIGKLVNIKIYAYENISNHTYVTKSFINSIDPNVQKEQRIREAATAEYARRVGPVLKSFVKDKDRLLKSISDITGDSVDRISLVQDVNHYIIRFSEPFDAVKYWDQVRSVIYKEFKHIYDAFLNRDSKIITIAFDSRQLDEIKEEIEDFFEVKI